MAPKRSQGGLRNTPPAAATAGRAVGQEGERGGASPEEFVAVLSAAAQRILRAEGAEVDVLAKDSLRRDLEARGGGKSRRRRRSV